MVYVVVVPFKVVVTVVGVAGRVVVWHMLESQVVKVLKLVTTEVTVTLCVEVGFGSGSPTWMTKLPI